MAHPFNIENAAGLSETGTRILKKLKHELGPVLLGLIDDPLVEDIMLNSDGKIWVSRQGEGDSVAGTMSAKTAESLMNTVASATGKKITPDSPILECELPFYGLRFEAVIPPATSGSPIFSIRKKPERVFPLEWYEETGTMTPGQRAAIEQAVREHKNILVVGGTRTGKTTLTNAIIHYMAAITPDDRIIIIEDTSELQCQAPNYVTLHTTTNVDMTRLLAATMRLNPSRILVGEVRDGAALALLKSWNTGHPGGVSTIHANTNFDAAQAGLIRLEQLVAEALPGVAMHALIAEAVDVVVAITFDEQGKRRISEVVSVEGYDKQTQTYITKTEV